MQQHRFEASGNHLRYAAQQNDIEYRGRGGGKDRGPALLRHLVRRTSQSFLHGKEQPAADEQRDDGAEQQDLDDMRFASWQLFEPVVRFQFFEDELDLPACRVGLSDGVCVERVRVDVGEVEPILAAVGESDRDQTQTTPSGTADAAIHATLERHLDFDVEDVSLHRPATSLSRLPTSSIERPRH